MHFSTRSTSTRWLFILTIALTFTVAIGQVDPARASLSSTGSPAADTPASPPSRAPSHISVTIPKPLSTLISGEINSFVLQAKLVGAAAGTDHPLFWNHHAATPLVIWIASPPDSGITFIDDAHPGRPRHHILIKFARTAKYESGALAATVNYCVTSRTSAGSHALWMDIYGELASADGATIQDMGIVNLPVVVDTHIGTKLLMLAVILAVVFLFIVEWVRVDVVAIAMMVLLPELGLLRAQDTFKGLSSNAVIAIIGVMIISYGLNRAGLVSRIIQPLIKYVGRSPGRLSVLFSGLIAVISSVMQNTGAAVLFLPAIRLGGHLSAEDTGGEGADAHWHGGDSRRNPDHDRHEPPDSLE